jgi:hypothetical protein
MCIENISIKFQLRTGGFFVVIPNDIITSPSLIAHAHTMFFMDNGTTVVLCEVLQASNQVKVELVNHENCWQLGRSPDILDDRLSLESHIARLVADDPVYFKVRVLAMDSKSVLTRSVCVNIRGSS